MVTTAPSTKGTRKQSVGAQVTLPKIKTQKRKIQRYLKNRESQTHENIKNAMFLRGTNSSETNNQLMKELGMLKKPNAVQLKKKNNIQPFEDHSSLEFFSNRNDCSLMVFGSHNKKRPNHLIFGRFFDSLVLDLIEVGIENFRSMQEFTGVTRPQAENKPCFIFVGEEFEQSDVHKRFANLLLDFFRGQVVNTINLVGLEHVIVCTSAPEKVYFRVYRTQLKKSGTKIPHVDLLEIGPSADFVIGRSSLATQDMIKASTKIPGVLRPKKVKNVKRDSFNIVGTMHMGKRQDLSELQIRKKKVRAWKKDMPEAPVENSKTDDME